MNTRPSSPRTHIISWFVSLTLLLTSSPAAPPVLAGIVSDAHLSGMLWFEASGWSTTLKGMFNGQGRSAEHAQEKQSERDARVARLEIYPGDVTVNSGERIFFTAVAQNRDGAAVGGVKLLWSVQDVERNRAHHISPTGMFSAMNSGTYKVRVEAAGKQAHVTVKVLAVERGPENEKPIRTKKVSTRDLPAEGAALEGSKKERQNSARSRRLEGKASFVRASYAAEMAAPSAVSPSAVQVQLEDPYSWNDTNRGAADDPINERGDMPGSSVDDGAGSGNFQLAAPVIALAGRGIDINLGLAYNSRVWTKADSNITFNIDRDWPAPGWSLGFGKLIGMGAYNGTMLIDADGTRHAYSGSSQIYSYGTHFTGNSIDGTFIDYYSYASGAGQNLSSGWAKYPNGTVVDYGAPGENALHPTRITDANGNYVTITYVNNQGPRIQTVTDTLGRVVNFHYDYNNLLTAVTGPGLGGTTRTLVRLHYKQHVLDYGFSGLMPLVRDQYPWVVDAIYYPATRRATGSATEIHILPTA